MSLNATIKSAVAKGFTALDDMKTPVTYHKASTTFDATTGINTDSTTDTSIDVVLMGATEAEISEGLMEQGEKKMLVQIDDMPLGFDLADTVTIIDDVHLLGKIWHVKSVTHSTGDVIATLILRG